MARQARGRIVAFIAFGFLLLFLVIRRSTTAPISIAEDVPVVMVLAVQAVPESNKKATAYLKKVVENRQEYAKRHGYKFVQKTLLQQDKAVQQNKPASESWLRLLALREALEEYPNAEWFWYLDQDAIIMDPQVSITEGILASLGETMMRDVPVVPPDSVIRTLKSGAVDNMHFILSQDHSGLNTKSFLLRNGEFAKYLLEAWTEPVSDTQQLLTPTLTRQMYRSYGFERQEVSALEHLIQWHYTVLSKTALLPKRILASYNNAADDMAYKESDFVVVLDGCRDAGRSCELEFERYWATRGRTVEIASDGTLKE